MSDKERYQIALDLFRQWGRENEKYISISFKDWLMRKIEEGTDGTK